MRRKVSEKLFLFAIVCIAAGLIGLLKAQVFTAPVRISEAGVLLSAGALCSLFFGIHLFRKSLVRM